MARIRTVKPEFWLCEDLATVSESSRLLAIALLNQADDDGYFRANPLLLKAAVSPLTEPSMSIHKSLDELSIIDYIRLYRGSDGKHYGLVVGFVKHQKINRPTPSKIKDLVDITESSVSAHDLLTTGKERKGKEVEQGREQGKESLPDKSDAIDVINYMNSVLETKFKSTTKAHIENINGRLSDGHSVEDLKLVIDHKSKEWSDDQRMAGYLRPQTLFAAGKFQGYLLAAKTKPKANINDVSNIEYQSGSF